MYFADLAKKWLTIVNGLVRRALLRTSCLGLILSINKIILHPGLLINLKCVASSYTIYIAMCLRVLRDALVSQVEYFRLRRSRATASERALVRASYTIYIYIIDRIKHDRQHTFHFPIQHEHENLNF